MPRLLRYLILAEVFLACAAMAGTGPLEAERKDNFGKEVSNAAKSMKAEILRDQKNFGQWVSSQRSQRRQAQLRAQLASRAKRSRR